jgi:hypothetical protein
MAVGIFQEESELQEVAVVYLHPVFAHPYTYKPNNMYNATS